MLFCRVIKICRDLRTLWKILGKKSVNIFLVKKQSFLGKKCTVSITWYMVYIAYYTCNYAQKRRICRENSKYAPADNFVAIFTFAERLPTSATLDDDDVDDYWEVASCRITPGKPMSRERGRFPYPILLRAAHSCSP